MAPKVDPKKKKEESSSEEESYEYETESSSEKPVAKKAEPVKTDSKKADAKPAAKKEESSSEEDSDEDESYEYETESESSEKKPAAKPAAAAAAAAKPAAAAADAKKAEAAKAAAKKDESSSEDEDEYSEYEYETESESSEKKPAAKPAAAAAAAAKPAAAAATTAAAKPAAAATADAKKAADAKAADAKAADAKKADAKPAAATTSASKAAPAAAAAAAVVVAPAAAAGPKTTKQTIAMYLAELLGTLIISFVIFQFRGQPASVYTSEPAGGVVSHALVQTLAVGGVAAAFGHLSGGHFNSGITFMQLLLRQIPVLQGLIYIVVQVAGAVLGGLLAWGLLPPATQLDVVAHYGTGFAAPYACTFAGSYELAGTQCWKEGFGAEIVGTFIICFAYAMVYAAGHGAVNWLSYAFAYGIATFAFHTTNNAYFNPARAIGGAVFTFDYAWGNFWIFIIGPFIGAIIAAIVFGFIFQTKEDKTIGESILKH